MLQLVSKVLVQERKRLIATEQTYMRSEDTMREQVCLAEHNADLGQTVSSQGFATLQVGVAAATCQAPCDRGRAHVLSAMLMLEQQQQLPAGTQQLLVCMLLQWSSICNVFTCLFCPVGSCAVSRHLPGGRCEHAGGDHLSRGG